jgi:hypothetical protein
MHLKRRLVLKARHIELFTDEVDKISRDELSSFSPSPQQRDFAGDQIVKFVIQLVALSPSFLLLRFFRVASHTTPATAPPAWMHMPGLSLSA